MVLRDGKLDFLALLAVKLPLVVSWRCGGPLLHGASPLRGRSLKTMDGLDETPLRPR
jgi:hypothetical protein